jgi:transcriptional regulator with XRE-family HTH domain
MNKVYHHDLAIAFAKLIRLTRAQNDSQEELAHRVGVARRTIQNLENGKNVGTDVLFETLSMLGLADEILHNVNTSIDNINSQLERKSRTKDKELDNDF